MSSFDERRSHLWHAVIWTLLGALIIGATFLPYLRGQCEWWRAWAGLAISALGGAALLHGVMVEFVRHYLQADREDKRPKHHSVSTAALGVVERIPYTIAFACGQFSWIGLWLLVKLAGQYSGWSMIEERHQRDTMINVALIGSLLSMMVSIAGAWLWKGQFPLPH